jgi:hypothetical protein
MSRQNYRQAKRNREETRKKRQLLKQERRQKPTEDVVATEPTPGSEIPKEST